MATIHLKQTIQFYTQVSVFDIPELQIQVRRQQGGHSYVRGFSQSITKWLKLAYECCINKSPIQLYRTKACPENIILYISNNKSQFYTRGHTQAVMYMCVCRINEIGRLFGWLYIQLFEPLLPSIGSSWLVLHYIFTFMLMKASLCEFESIYICSSFWTKDHEITKDHDIIKLSKENVYKQVEGERKNLNLKLKLSCHIYLIRS